MLKNHPLALLVAESLPEIRADLTRHRAGAQLQRLDGSGQLDKARIRVLLVQGGGMQELRQLVF